MLLLVVPNVLSHPRGRQLPAMSNMIAIPARQECLRVQLVQIRRTRITSEGRVMICGVVR